jgi:hypothetical protein
MISKRIKPSVFYTLIGFSTIILCIIAYGSLREAKQIPESKITLNIQPQTDTVNCQVLFRDSIVSFGMEFLGTPYVEAASNKHGFDCSGFVFFVFKHFNIQVPRSSSQYMNFGNEIPIDSLKKGDILVFKSPTINALGHVGIVTNPKGRESEFIHASSGREMKVIISSLKQKGYKRRFVKAVNVL